MPPEPVGGTDPRDPRLLAEYLAGRSVPCPRCGYDLRDLRGTRCPECGDALRLQVGLVEPRPAAFLTLTLFAGMAAATGGLFWLFLWAEGGIPRMVEAFAEWVADPAGPALLPTSYRGRQMPIAGILLALAVGGAAVLTACLVRRRAFRRLSLSLQWAAAGAAGAAVAGLWALIIALVLLY
jgi:hypothetical protein